MTLMSISCLKFNVQNLPPGKVHRQTIKFRKKNQEFHFILI